MRCLGAKAQHGLGWMYATGQGVPQDFVHAHKWFHLASTKDLNGAREARDKLADFMTRADIKMAQRLAHEWLKEHP